MSQPQTEESGSEESGSEVKVQFGVRRRGVLNINRKPTIPKPRGPKTTFGIFMTMYMKKLRKLPRIDKDLSIVAISKKCAEIWHNLPDKSKQPFRNLAKEDRDRYSEEMKQYLALGGEPIKKRILKIDPNAPKRPVSEFMMFSRDTIPVVQAKYPWLRLSGVREEVKTRWDSLDPEEKAKYHALCWEDKQRYARERRAYYGSKIRFGRR